MINNYLKSVFICILLSSLTCQITNAQVGIGTTHPSAGSILDITSTNKGILIPRVNIANLTTIAPVTGGSTTSLLVWNTNATTGVGFHYWDGNDWIPLGSGWKLRGNASTTPGTNFLGTTDNVDMLFRRNNTDQIRLYDGYSSFRDEILIRDGSVSGNDRLIRLYDSFDDGVFDIYRDNAVNHRIHGNGDTVFNETGSDLDLRIESDNEENMFYLNAAEDQVFIKADSHHVATYIDSFNAYAQSFGSAPTGIQYAIAGWNQGDQGGGGNFVIEDTTNGYAAMEAATDGIGVASKGLIVNNTGSATGVNGVTNSDDGIGVHGDTPTGGAGFAILSEGDVGYTAGFYSVSDARAKKDIKSITSALEKISQIEGYTYKYDRKKYNPNAAEDNTTYYGFLAQNIKKALPHSVAEKNVIFSDAVKSKRQKKEDYTVSEKLNVVNYTSVIPVLVEAVKEQQDIIKTKDSKIEDLEQRLSNLEHKLNQLLTQD